MGVGHLAMQYWLMKSEPSDCSVDDLAAAPDQTVPWYGVRNFQARNFRLAISRLASIRGRMGLVYKLSW